MRRLILIRHGKTEWSEEGRYLGTADVSLNERGIKQADAIAQALSKEELEIIYSSTLSRASVTAKIIARKHKVPHLKDSRLNELSFGDWEGLTFSEITKKLPNGWKGWQKDLENFSPPKGESGGALKGRVLSFLNPLIEDLGNQTIAIVSHLGPIKIMLLHALGVSLKPFWRIKLDHASLSVIECYRNRPLISSINRTSHLRNVM